MSAQVAADLRAAADVLERDGWTQGRYRDADGRCCVRGAVHVALYDEAPHPTRRSGVALSAFEDYLIEQGTPVHLLGASGTHWNDAPGRTAAEVIAALRAAADRAEAEA